MIKYLCDVVGFSASVAYLLFRAILSGPGGIEGYGETSIKYFRREGNSTLTSFLSAQEFKSHPTIWK